MANEFNRIQPNDDSRSLTELELLEALLAPDDAIYPWNPADLKSEAIAQCLLFLSNLINADIINNVYL